MVEQMYPVRDIDAQPFFFEKNSIINVTNPIRNPSYRVSTNKVRR